MNPSTRVPLPSVVARPRRRQLLLAGLAAAAAVPLAPLAGCGGGTELLFVPFFVFTFDGRASKQVAGQKVSFFLNTAAGSSCTESGRFEFARVTVDDGVKEIQFDVTGSFKGRDLNLTISRPPAVLAAAYTGRFDDDQTLVLTAVGEPTDKFSVVRTQPRDTKLCPG
jgi:hypothetical protein